MKCAVYSFLPKEDKNHTYVQAPYEEIDSKTYLKLKSSMPDIDFSQYKEKSDNTISSQELSCTAGICEI